MPQGKGAKPLRLNVGLVIQMRETKLGTIFVVSAPRRRTSGSRSTTGRESRAAPAGGPGDDRALGLDALLSCDETGEVSLETVEVPFPPPSESPGNDTFSLDRGGRRPHGIGRVGAARALDRREELVERVLAALGAETRASVMLVGPHDVGKTALVDEVASGSRPATSRAPLAGRRAVADLGERADRRGELHGHVAGAGRAR